MRGRDGRHAVRGGRRRVARRDRGGRASASTSCTGSGTGSAPRRTKTRTWSPATTRRSRPGTRSASSPASTSPDASACASKTSSSPPLAGPLRLNDRAARYRDRCVKLDAGTFLLQWATGGLLFGWVTTRRREVSLGYGWLIRIMFGVMAAGAALLFLTGDHSWAHDVAAAASIACVAAAMLALAVSVQRRAAGVRGREEVRARAPGAGLGDDRPRPTKSPPSLGPGVPARARPDRADPRDHRIVRGRAVRGRSVPARAGAARRRRGVPRQRERRDAARPLVPRAARTPARPDQGTRRSGPRSRGRSRSRCSCGRPAWCRC